MAGRDSSKKAARCSHASPRAHLVSRLRLGPAHTFAYDGLDHAAITQDVLHAFPVDQLDLKHLQDGTRGRQAGTWKIRACFD